MTVLYIVSVAVRVIYGRLKIRSSKLTVTLLLMVEISIIHLYFLSESYTTIIVVTVLVFSVLFFGFMQLLPTKDNKGIVFLILGALPFFFLMLFSSSVFFDKPKINNIFQNVLTYPLELMQLSNYPAKFWVSSHQNQSLPHELLDQSTKTEYGGMYTKYLTLSITQHALLF